MVYISENMSLSKVLDETFGVWLNSFQGEISDDEEASKIWAGFKYAISLANKEDGTEEKAEYEKAHGRYIKSKEKLDSISRKRKDGTYFYYQGRVYPCIGGFDPEDWKETDLPTEPLKTEGERLSELQQKYDCLKKDTKNMIEEVFACVPKDKVLYFGWDYLVFWFTYNKETYSKEGSRIEASLFGNSPRYEVRRNKKSWYWGRGRTFDNAKECFGMFWRGE
ncbi:hypothetical protein PMV_125 [Port-miou virus]|uniref:Uncharacterized protein n=1 Tax=Port-miou virus TaxID=1733873 RepID=A0A0N9PYX3_9VIRU|nr:hypothetical protein PMV_125 [Port-miou virus]